MLIIWDSYLMFAACWARGIKGGTKMTKNNPTEDEEIVSFALCKIGLRGLCARE